jgi:hypothetical protein
MLYKAAGKVKLNLDTAGVDARPAPKGRTSDYTRCRERDFPRK